MHMLHSPRKKILAAILGVLLLVGIGYGIVMLFNQKPASSVEIEQGQAAGNGPVTVGDDPNASGGKYIQFDPKQE